MMETTSPRGGLAVVLSCRSLEFKSQDWFPRKELMDIQNLKGHQAKHALIDIETLFPHPFREKKNGCLDSLRRELK